MTKDLESKVCSLCKEEAIRTLQFKRISHYYCAFHAGYLQAIVELTLEQEPKWVCIEEWTSPVIIQSVNMNGITREKANGMPHVLNAILVLESGRC